jgi:Tol biopolymer transport system component/DNA-binding winged helix-turn-helix (wHTH) protein
MAETQSRTRLVRFGAFEADAQTGELRKDGVKLKFSGQPFQVLAILLERPGEVITREELQKRLWPDTFVDVERNLNSAVNKIREVLGDSADTPRFVETLPRRGYRFIGQVEAPQTNVVTVALDQAPQFRPRWLRIAVFVVVITTLALGVLVVSRWQRRNTRSESEVMTGLPFTSFPGQEIAPAISPDGSRVAFAWNKDAAGIFEHGFDLYVKAIGSETLLRLTNHPSNWISSAWSPDGSQIAFHTLRGNETGVYIVPALGGPERKLVSTRIRTSPLLSISWSPDGRWIAYSDYSPGKEDLEHVEIALLSTDNLESKRLPNTRGCVNTAIPAFSHNGGHLAYWCLRSMNEFALYSMPFPEGQGKEVLTIRGFPSGLSWSADDAALIYANETGLQSKLFVADVASGTFKTVEVAENPWYPTVSSKGDKLAYSFFSTNIAIWRRDLLHPESPPVELVPSTHSQYDAQYSPDGKQIAFSSERSGVQGVWVSGEDGANLVQISKPKIRSGSPQWSPDGKRVAFDAEYSGRWAIYVADISKGTPQRLATNISDFARPHWSRDGRWIYFTSNELGRTGAYRCPSQGGDAIAISKDRVATAPQESYDGTIYYASGSNRPLLKRVAQSALPGIASEVDGLPRLLSYAIWITIKDGVYFVPAESPRSLRHFDLATKRIRSVFEADKDFASGISVSSDGRWMLYSQSGNANSDIMLIDNFH